MDWFAAVGESSHGWYRGLATHFLKDVAKTLPRSFEGEALVVTSDAVDLPVEMVRSLSGERVAVTSPCPALTSPCPTILSNALQIKALHRIGVPLLAHTIRRSSRRDAILIPDWQFVHHRGFNKLMRKVNA